MLISFCFIICVTHLVVVKTHLLLEKAVEFGNDEGDVDVVRRASVFILIGARFLVAALFRQNNKFRRLKENRCYYNKVNPFFH
jgi:hypothetical protein